MVENYGDGDAAGSRGDSAELERRGGYLAGGKNGTDGEGGNLDAFCGFARLLLGAMMISIASAAGGQVRLFGAGQQHGRQQREAEGDQQ